MKKVLIVSQRSGAGHERAAEALEKGFKIVCGDAAEIKRVDFLDYAGPTVRNILGRGYTELAKRLPEVYGFLDGQLSEIGSFKNWIPLIKMGAPKFISLLKKEKADVIVATHPLPAALVLDLEKKKSINTKGMAVIVTDYRAHLLFVVGKRYNLDYFVANEEIVWDLKRAGISAPNIHLTGIPIDPVFSGAFDRAALIKKLKINANKLTVLLFAGSFASIDIIQILKVLKQFRDKLQIIAISGKNQRLYRKIMKIRRSNPEFIPQAFHWVPNIEELMAVSDVLVSKPGGIVASEATALGLPLVIIDPIPGQEEANAIWLLENCASLWAMDQRQLILKIMTLINHPEKLTHLKYNARRIGQPRSAIHIAEIIDHKYLKTAKPGPK